jgi:hypothetical protein
VVRCTNCDAGVSEWAARCPKCGASLDDAAAIVEEPAAPGPVSTRPSVAGLDGAKQRRISLRAATIGLAIVAVIGVTTGVVATGRGGLSRSGPPAPGLLRTLQALGLGPYAVVSTGRDGVHVIPVAGGPESHPITMPTGSPVSTSDGVVFVSGGTAYLLAPPFSSPPRPMVGADRLFPMEWPGTVGVGSGAAPGAVRVQYLDLQSGNPTGAPMGELPRGYQPVTQAVAVGPGGVLRTWEPGAGGLTRLGPALGDRATVLGSDGQVVAWLAAGDCAPNGECSLHITTIESAPESGPLGGDRLVGPPRGHHGFLGGGALSPDGQLLAAFVSVSRGRQAQAELAIIDMTTLQVTLIANSIIPTGIAGPSAQWTPDGAFVFFSGSKGHMYAYQQGDTKATALDIKGSTSFAVG